MDEKLATQHDIPALKKEIRQIIESFINGYRTICGNLLTDLERVEKDLSLLSDDENLKNTKHSDIFILLGNIAKTTSKSKASILEKLTPSELNGDNHHPNPLRQTLAIFIDTPEFKELEKAHEKISLIQSLLVPNYCNEELQKISSKVQSNHHRSIIEDLRGKIAVISMDETDPHVKTGKIKDAILNTKNQMSSRPSNMFFGIFIHNDPALIAALEAFISNLPEPSVSEQKVAAKSKTA